MAVSARESRAQAAVCWIIGFFTAVSGVCFLIGGAVLFSRGGSAYYLIMGIGLIIAAYGLFKRQAWSAVVYMLTLAGTVIWSVYDGGWVLAALTCGPKFF